MKMRIGTCRTTKNGARYCRTKKGVRFVRKGSRRGYGRSSGVSGTGRGREMRMNECRRTSAGVKYCRTKKGVRFRRG